MSRSYKKNSYYSIYGHNRHYVRNAKRAASKSTRRQIKQGALDQGGRPTMAYKKLYDIVWVDDIYHCYWAQPPREDKEELAQWEKLAHRK